jgi:hypothetical protein
MDRLLILLKFGRHDHLQQLRTRGLLHAKPQRYFQELESDPQRGDRFETTDHVFQPNLITKLIISKHPRPDFVITPDHLRGPVLMSVKGERCNIYCMFAITQPASPLVDEQNLAFGERDAFVVILNTQTFLDRVSSAASSRGLRCECGLVKYCDYESYSGETGPFRKPVTYAHQKEFRFIFQPGCDSPINLEIGSLVDITSDVLPLSDINRLIDLR